MDELIKNVEDKIGLLDDELISELDDSIRIMKADHSAKGLLKSGNTIKFVMDEINSTIEKYHFEIIKHIRSLPFSHSEKFEATVSEVVIDGFNRISVNAYKRLEEIATFAGRVELYERMLPEVMAEDRKSQERFKNSLNACSLELHNELNKESKPWEVELVKLWRYVTRGRRKTLTIPLLLVLIIIPASAGIIDSYKNVAEHLSAVLTSDKSIPSKAESDVFNEWIIAVGNTENEKKAIELKSKFIAAYISSNHVNYKNEPIWVNDIFHVRHPVEKGVWMVVVDAFSGPSSKSKVKEELNELALIAFSTRELANTFGHYLYGADVIYYAKNDFIGTYGEIVGQ